MGYLQHEYVKKYQCFAFSLVELLVVISIIAVLLAILMPSLQKARDNGQKAVCGFNLQQLGLGWQLYANDNKSTFPIGGAHSTSTQFPGLPFWYHSGIGIAKYMPTVTLDERDPRIRLPSKEEVSHVWYCPSHTGQAISYCRNKNTRPSPWRTVQYPAVGYCFNYHIGYQRYQKVEMIKATSAVPLLFDFWLTKDMQDASGWPIGDFRYYIGDWYASPHPSAGSGGQYCFVEGVAYAHKEASNFLCADGHVQLIGKSSGIISPAPRGSTQWENNLKIYQDKFKWLTE
jgi:prepilin-type N-terminal cleavage/methylation domain-containing protein